MIENSGASLWGMLEVQHDSSNIELTADVAGFVRSWIERQREADVDVVWHPAGDGWANLPDVAELHGMPFPQKTRMLRLLANLNHTWPLHGSWCARAISAAGALGMHPLSNSLLNVWMNQRWPPFLEGRARSLLRMVQHRLTNTLVRERLSPDGSLWLGDLPGGLAPLATRRWLWLWKREPLEVLSGGDRLAPGTWLWEFDAEGHGSVVERRPPDAAGI